MGTMPASIPQLVNPVSADEVREWTRAMVGTFLGDPDGPGTTRRIELLTRGWDRHGRGACVTVAAGWRPCAPSRGCCRCPASPPVTPTFRSTP
jgi:hypothetical protein